MGLRAWAKSDLGRDALSRLSIAAVRSAVALRSADLIVVAGHLYSYNRIPSTSGWHRHLADLPGIHRALGFPTNSDLEATLEASWLRLPSTFAPGWLAWSNRASGLELGGSAPDFKLYVSPAVEALERVFPELVRVSTFSRARSFKVGADGAGLLRPDKLVAYFSCLGDLAEAAHELGRRLDGVPAHGVPFTAEILGDGLLSWGVDPCLSAETPGNRTPSWREWICHRLAEAIISASQENSGSKPAWQRALDRLQADGIRVDRWLPSPAYWGIPTW